MRPYLYGSLDLPDFIKSPFDTLELERLPTPSGFHIEARIGDSMVVRTENLGPKVLRMQSAQKRNRHDIADRLAGSESGASFAQRQMSADPIGEARPVRRDPNPGLASK